MVRELARKIACLVIRSSGSRQPICVPLPKSMLALARILANDDAPTQGIATRRHV
jgi:hypothetical protein